MFNTNHRASFLARYGDDDHAKQILKDQLYKPSQKLAGNPTLSSHTLHLAHLSAPAYSAKLDVLSHPNFNHFDHINLNDNEIQRSVIANPNAPQHVLSKIFHSTKNTLVRSALYKHPNSSHEILSHALESHIPSDIRSALSNPSCSPKHLEEYSKHDDETYRETAFANPNLPKHVIDAAVKDPNLDHMSTIGLLKNPAAPQEFIHKHITGKSEELQYHATENPNVTREDIDLVIHKNNHMLSSVGYSALEKFYPNGYDKKQNTFTAKVNALHKEIMS